MNDGIFPVLARIDGQGVNVATIDQAIDAVTHYAGHGRGFRLFTLNLDHLVKRRDNAAFRAAYAGADLVTADGAPVAFLARRQDGTIARTTGADLVRPLCRAAGRRGIPVALFGSTEATLAASAAALLRENPGLRIVHREAPPFGFDPTSPAAATAASRMAAAGAKLVFVALGAPKQELFAAHVAAIAPHLGFICIGAGLDFIAGSQVRAPGIVQRVGMEWFWRLATNPSRLARRYAACAAILFSLVIART